MTTQEATAEFERALTVLNDRSVRLGGHAISLQDPRVIAAQLVGQADVVRMSSIMRADGTDPMARAFELGAQVIAFCVAVAREDELRVDTGDELREAA